MHPNSYRPTTILSAFTGYILPPSGLKGLFALLTYMLYGEEIKPGFTAPYVVAKEIALYREKVVASLALQFPDLYAHSKLIIPGTLPIFNDHNNLLEQQLWVERMENHFGKELPVQKLNPSPFINRAMVLKALNPEKTSQIQNPITEIVRANSPCSLQKTQCFLPFFNISEHRQTPEHNTETPRARL